MPAEQGLPRYLYKYRAESSLGIEDLILRNRIYFPSPEGFNDPFDCAPTIDTHSSERDRKRFYEAATANDPPRPRTERRQQIANARHNSRNKSAKAQLDQSLTDYMRQLTGVTGVLSLSAVPDQILMWSHYADSHQGFCLRFRTDQGRPISDAREVHYQGERPIVKIFSEPQEVWVKSALLTKADYWSYEKEWRVINFKGVGSVELSPTALDGVIFGARISSSLRERITKLAAHRENIEFLNANFDPKNFRLHLTNAPAGQA
jgi:hypothetical protein